MRNRYLLPNKFKLIGWFVFIPSLIFALMIMFMDYEPEFFVIKIPAFLSDNFLNNTTTDTWINENIFNEIVGMSLIIGLIFIGLSKQKIEDEYIAQIRYESLVWSLYVNYTLLLISFIFFFSLDFLTVMVIHMYSLLMFFIARFYWKVLRL